MVIAVTCKRVSQTFGGVAASLVCAHVLIQSVRFVSGDDRLFGLVSFLSLGAENNLPTIYASSAILFCALLLTLVGLITWRNERRWSYYWFVLALVFLFLSLDESLQLHERLIDPVRTIVGATGLLYYAWVIPYGAGLIVFVAVYIRFLLHIPRRTATLFVVAGLLFVSGAIVLEMISGYVYQEAGSRNILYVAVQTLEETLEMGGIVLFIYALFDYIEKTEGTMHLVIGQN